MMLGEIKAFLSSFSDYKLQNSLFPFINVYPRLIKLLVVIFVSKHLNETEKGMSLPLNRYHTGNVRKKVRAKTGKMFTTSL
jgi:hypothetical protein